MKHCFTVYRPVSFTEERMPAGKVGNRAARTHVPRKVGDLVLQKAVLPESPPRTAVHLCGRVFSGHGHLASLHLFEQLGASLHGQLVQRHVVVAHPQQLAQLALPRGDALPGPTEHHIQGHPAGAQPPGLFDGLQGLTGAVVSAQSFQILILQRLKELKSVTRATTQLIIRSRDISSLYVLRIHLDPDGEAVHPCAAVIR